MDSTIADILALDHNVLALRLSTYTNVELVNNFKRDFEIMDHYKPGHEFDKLHVLEYSKVYVDEFKRRIAGDTITQIAEFATLLKDLMNNDHTTAESYYTRTLIRLYSYAVGKLQKSQMSAETLKRNFL